GWQGNPTDTKCQAEPVHGAGIFSWRQIARTKGSGLSLCRGTGARSPIAEFSKMEWLCPSRSSVQPFCAR
ncbi:MAG TPA: hypothetical protein VGH74_02820, partial [Planctomycetaceae bacterium]